MTMDNSLNPITQPLIPKIKIAQVITRMEWGGSPDIVRILCEGLDKDNFDLTLITGPGRNLSAKTREFFEKFKANLIVVPFLKREINPLFDFFAFINLYCIFKKKKFDIIHTHTAKAGILGRTAAHWAGVQRIVHTSHGYNFYGYFGPRLSRLVIRLERWAAGFTSKLVVLTALERNDLIKFKVAGGTKISVVHAVVEFTEYKKLDNIERLKKKEQLGINTDEITVGMVGRLEPVKGVQYFVEAAVLLCNKFKKIKFIAAGEGSLRKELELKIKQADLEQQFIFLGWRDDALEIISVLDLLVLPSLNEAVGMVLLEAQGLGVPVVATKTGGIPEVVEDGKSGILVAPANTAELAKAIEELIVSKEKREQMGQYAQEKIKDKYDAEDFVQQISRIYHSLKNGKN